MKLVKMFIIIKILKYVDYISCKDKLCLLYDVGGDYGYYENLCIFSV